MDHLWVSQKEYKEKIEILLPLEKCFKKSSQKEREGKLEIATSMELGIW